VCYQGALSYLPLVMSSLVFMVCYQGALSYLPLVMSSLVCIVCYQGALSYLPLVMSSLVCIVCYLPRCIKLSTSCYEFFRLFTQTADLIDTNFFH